MRTYRISTLIVLCYFLNIPISSGDANYLLDISKDAFEEKYNDIIRITMIYKKLKEEERNLLKSKNAEILTNAIKSNEFLAAQQKISNISEHMLSNYEKELIEDILHDVICKALTSHTLLQMVDVLWQLYEEGDQNSFELMLHAQIQLYRFFSETPYTRQKEFQQKYAFMLKKIKHEKNYSTAKMYLKSDLEGVVNKLPNNIQYLLFNPYFCLMNANYSEYVYTADYKIDNDNHFILLWDEKFAVDEAGRITADVYESNSSNNSNFKITLKGIKHQVYYYRMPSTNLIAGWKSNDEPINYIWDIEFIDNDIVVLSQLDYLMCSTDNMHDEHGRITTGYLNGEMSAKSKACQWYLGKCDRR